MERTVVPASNLHFSKRCHEEVLLSVPLSRPHKSRKIYLYSTLFGNKSIYSTNSCIYIYIYIYVCVCVCVCVCVSGYSYLFISLHEINTESVLVECRSLFVHYFWSYLIILSFFIYHIRIWKVVGCEMQ